MSSREYDLRVVRQKIEYFCAYQERSQKQVLYKLREFGLSESTCNILITDLINAGFLNESRYAEAFVSGKYRIKKWGRIKIKQALRKENISDNNIKAALDIIDEDLYIKHLTDLYIKKHQDYKKRSKKTPYQRKASIEKYLFEKGFEWDLIKAIGNDVIS